MEKDKVEKISNKMAFAIMKRQLKAYAKADKQGKGKILDALESVLHRPRKYDEPRAPFRRVLEQSSVSNISKKLLLDQYDHLNPKHLLDRIKALTDKLEKVQRKQGYHY